MSTSAESVLIVEDDPKMAEMLVQAMRESGYESLSVSNGEEALSLAPSYDVIVADVMMPRRDGFSMTATLRQNGYKQPIILVTARDSTADVVRGLDAGADDYLVKPFKLDELLARVRSNLRRAGDLKGIIKWSDIELDLNQRIATRAGNPLPLSSTEFALLQYFIKNPGRIISKTELLSSVWHDEGSRDENLVEIYINYVRKKTEGFGGPRAIQTVRGSGYVLIKKNDP